MSREEAAGAWVEIRETRARNMSFGEPCVSMRTLRRWAAAYRNEGLEGLYRKERPDSESIRGLGPKVLQRAIGLKEELPRRSVRQIIDIMTAEGTIEPGQVARSTLSRHLKEAGMMDIPKRTPKGTRRFVKERPNQLWQGDIKYGPYVPDSSGKPKRTYLFAFIDDYSRLIPHAEFHFGQKGHSLESCVRKGIVKRGVPEAVYVDNEKVFVSLVFRVACATLGIRHLPAAPYSPQGKGKIERWIGFADSSFIHELKFSPALSFQELNDRFWVWLEEFYHKRPHSSLDGKSPLEVWQAGIGEVRIETPEAITAAFLHSAKRKVDHTGCISFRGCLYSVGAKYANKKVSLRYDPSDLSRIDVLYDGEHVAETKPIEIAVEDSSHEPEHAPEAEKVSFDELLARQQQVSSKRRLEAISFYSLESERDV